MRETFDGGRMIIPFRDASAMKPVAIVAGLVQLRAGVRRLS